ncbi:NAD(+) synthase [Cereibacter changlensis]|uniref:NAD(+) synthase n=1 Tax=Cereibacter changlensis TaxID=402884 RepID=UPI004033317A
MSPGAETAAALKVEILDLARQPAGALSPWFEARLEEQLAQGLFLPGRELEAVRQKLVRDLADYRTQAGIDTAVLGMSGGVDSALTAALLKAAGWRVIGLTLPIEQDPIETERGVEACAALGLEHLHLDLSAPYEAGIASLASLDGRIGSADDAAHRTRRGNLRARLRMMTLYDQAHRFGGLVASTDNFSELGAGFWTLHGDVGDLAPVQSLLKSWEVPWMARASGVPERTWRAMPTDGLGIGGGDEAQIGATYLEWDILIFALMAVMRDEPDLSTQHLAFVLGMDEDRHAQLVLGTVLARLAATWHKRANPIRLDHPMTDRYGPLAALDARLFRPAVLKSEAAMLSFSGELQAMANHLVRALEARGQKLVTAESCTAGLLAACVAQVPACSDALSGSFVTYSPGMKIAALGVPEALIDERTVYDPEVARRMATGALAAAPEAGLAIAITGVAGPDDDQGKPAGWVCIATACRGSGAEAVEHRFDGGPEQVIAATLRAALEAGRLALARDAGQDG